MNRPAHRLCCLIACLAMAAVAAAGAAESRGTEAAVDRARSAPVIEWAPPAPITYGTVLGPDQLNATADVPGTFVYSPATGTRLNAGPNQTLTAVFTPADPARHAAVTVLTRLTVHKAAALVSLHDLSQPYDGQPKDVAVTTLPGNLKATLTYRGEKTPPIFPGRYTVSAVIDDANYAGEANDALTISITAVVRHAPILSGAVDGSVQVVSGEDVVLDDTAWLSGDLLVPGTPALRLYGLPMIAGTVDADGRVRPSDYAVALTGSTVVRYLVRRIDPPALPGVEAPLAPAGRRNVTLPADGAPGDFATVRNLVLSAGAGAVAVPPGAYERMVAERGTTLIVGRAGSTTPGVYHLQGLSLGAGAALRAEGPVLLLLGGDVTIAGDLGEPAHAAWLALALANGGLTLAPGGRMGGFVLAPKGTVTLQPGSALTGEVISDGLTVESGAALIEPAN